MTKEKLNSLALQYRDTRSNSIFEEIYNEVSPVWERSVQSDAAVAGVDERDMWALYEDVLLKVIEAFDPKKSDLEHFLNSSLANAKRDLRKEKGRLYRRELFGIMKGHGADEESAATLDFESSTDIPEEDAVFSVQRKRDQRQLISFLVAQAGDDFTEKVISLLPSYDFSVTALGKALGVHHSKVARAIKRLSRYYDEQKFGDVRDYLTA